MTAITSRGAGDTGARALLSGTVSNGATWYEDISMTEDGTAIANTPEGWEWRMMFREASQGYDAAPALTLSTTDSTLAISQGTDSTVLQIRVDATSLSAMEGDYICDLASQDTNDRIIHWGHGLITFRHEPIWSS